MVLADYHTHSSPYSPDAVSTLEEMAAGAAARGLTHMCVTNHVENCSQCPSAHGQFPPFRDWDALRRDFEAVRQKYSGTLDLRLGAELAAPHYLPEEGRRVYSLPFLDFVIGSIHNLRDSEDFYYMDYPRDFELFRPTVERYLEEYLTLAKSGLCDVLGHIGYMRRYMARVGLGFDMMEFEGPLREIFSAAIERGVGIELNTSGLFGPLGDFIPSREVMRLYRELGGEIVTVGSDSHTREKVGLGIREGYELLRECGFRYVCLYREHRPEFRIV